MKLRNLLALALGLLLALTPLSAALAAGEDATEPVKIDIDEGTPAEQRTQERDVGDITVTGNSNVPAAKISVIVEGQGTIRAEDVTAEKVRSTAIGAQVSATAPKAQATVEANKIAATTEKRYAYGALIEASNGGKAAVTAEAVTATAPESAATGVSADATDGGAATVQITGEGGVQVECYGAGLGLYLTSRGTDAVIEAQVAGDIAVQCDSMPIGVNAAAISGDKIELVCGGSVSAEGNGAIGLKVSAVEDDAQTAVTVAGDVVATGEDSIGLSVYAANTGAAEVLVEGTLSGATAVEVWGAGTEEAATLTVWALEGEIVGTRGGDAEAFAQRIQYILKADPIEGGDVALDGAAEYKGYNVATAGTTVTVRPNLAEGYILLGVNNNDTALAKDEDGHFFLKVPQGGGVYFTFDVGEVPGDWPLPETPIYAVLTLQGASGRLIFYNNGVCQFLQDGRTWCGNFGFPNGSLWFILRGLDFDAQADESGARITVAGETFALDAAALQTLQSRFDG